MATNTTVKLPVIDFSDLKPETKVQVRRALEEYGCFEASYDGIPQDLRNSVFGGVQQIFELPLETKLRNNPSDPQYGYTAKSPYSPLYESMGLGGVLNLQTVETFTNCMWPQGNPTFSTNLHCFGEKLSKLEKEVRRMILESFELEKYMNEQMNSTFNIIRFLKYDAPHSNETKSGLGSHTDPNLITILCHNQVAGLQILTKDGQWVDVNLSPNHFTVHIGDAFYAWINGWLQSVEHRVMMKGDVDRYTIGFFSTPKAGYIMKAPEELVDEEHPLLFKPFDHVMFMDYLISGPMRNPQATLKEYCGADSGINTN